jgi:hypothetical protein
MSCRWSGRLSVTTGWMTSCVRCTPRRLRRNISIALLAEFAGRGLARRHGKISAAQAWKRADWRTVGTERAACGTVTKSQTRQGPEDVVGPVTMTSKNIVVGGATGSSILAGLVCGNSDVRWITAHAATLVLCRLGLFQLGFLHLGQTFGSVTDVVRLGTHSWSHLLQMQTNVWPMGMVPPVFVSGCVNVALWGHRCRCYYTRQ